MSTNVITAVVNNTVALSNLKAADLKGLEVGGMALAVTLKGYTFAVSKRVPGQLTDYVCVVGKGIKGLFTFDTISDLKDCLRNEVALITELNEEPKGAEVVQVAPQDFSKVGVEATKNLSDRLLEFLKPTCPSVSDLAYQVTESGNLFFTKKTMKFFGDTLGNYGTRMVQQQDGSWIIELFRRKPVKHNTGSSAYFDAVTFKRLHSVTLKDGQ